MGNQTAFKSGHKGGPGRPKGSPNHNGMIACLRAIEEVITKPENLKLLKEQIDEMWKENPARVFIKFGMPLLPRNTIIEAPGLIEAIAEVHFKPLKNKCENCKNGNNNKK